MLDGPDERQKHLATAASQGVDGELISRLGPIKSVLLGESSPLAAMAEDGLLHRCYAHSVRLAPSLTRLSTLVRKVAHKNPAARVLQIGAGIGAAAIRCILEAIGTLKTSVVASWHITEPSADVLEDTQAKLADWTDLLEFSLSNINRDPSKQSFTPESYDIVVCYQSLNIAEDVAGTLVHVRNLLKPGGTLLLAETTRDQSQADVSFILGLLTTATSSLEPLFQQNRPLRLEVGIPGHLDTLAFVDDEGDDATDENLDPEAVKITPRVFGLSSRDVMAALGQLKDHSMGLECAGVVWRVGDEARTKGGYNVGDRVMALLPGDGSASLCSNITIPWNGSIVKVPSSITSFKEAASLPLAFTIAYAGLIDAARLAPGQSVFIHAAAGAIGQAAITPAKHLGVTDIYATAGSPEKRELVSRKYGIPAQRIFGSR